MTQRAKTASVLNDPFHLKTNGLSVIWDISTLTWCHCDDWFTWGEDPSYWAIWYSTKCYVITENAPKIRIFSGESVTFCFVYVVVGHISLSIYTRRGRVLYRLIYLEMDKRKIRFPPTFYHDLNQSLLKGARFPSEQRPLICIWKYPIN